MSFIYGISGFLIWVIIHFIREYRKSKIQESTDRIADDTVDTPVDVQPSTDVVKQPEQRSALVFLKEVAAHNQFVITELDRNEEWVTCAFEYQGGSFICYANAKSDELLLHFYCVADCPYSPENYENVRTICQNATRQYRYTKLVYSYDESDNKLSLHIRIETIGPSEQAFMYYVSICFQLANEARRYLMLGPDKSEEEKLDEQRDRHMLLTSEMAHEQNEHARKHRRRNAPEQGTIGEYISYLFDGENVKDLIRLTIQNTDGLTTLCQKDKIAGYNLLSAIVDDSGEEAVLRGFNPVVLTVDAVSNHYVFTLHPLEVTKELISVRMTAVCTPHEYLQDYVPDATYEPRAVSMRLCYVKSELTAEDTEADEELPQTNMGAQVKHGHKLLQQQCYLQAIAVLTPIFQKLKPRYFNLSEKERNMFFQVCFYIGFSYSDLQMYDKAFYYLDMVKDCNRFDYSQEYINCITNSGDPCVFTVLSNEAKAIGQQIDEVDKDPDCGTERMMAYKYQLLDYLAFLERRRGYAQISFGYLDDAEETFKRLLEHDGSREYAENELKYIEQLRHRK